MSPGGKSTSLPRSMRHKQILNVAENNPDASKEEIASEVPSATPDLVEYVFDEYGDPVNDENTMTQAENDLSSSNESPNRSINGNDTPATAENQSETNENSESAHINKEPTDTATENREYPSVDGLSEKQLEVLEVIQRKPEATQKEVAGYLDVSRGAVSYRVNSIEGFEWDERESFVTAVFDEPPDFDESIDTPPSTESDRNKNAQTDSAESLSVGIDGSSTIPVAPLEKRINRLEERVSELKKGDSEGKQNDKIAFQDTELVPKIVHACMKSETISETEELQILKNFLNS